MNCKKCGTKLKDYLFQVNGRPTWGEGCDSCESVINLRPVLGYCYMKPTTQEEFAKMYPSVDDRMSNERIETIPETSSTGVLERT